jgi:arylsulfatase A-like enzyme
MKEGPARVCRASRSLAIPEDHPTMAEFMRDAGYVTGMIGKWDIASREQGPLDRGFMEVARSAPSKKLFICLKPVHHRIRNKNHVKTNKASICKTYNCCWGCVCDWLSQSP